MASRYTSFDVTGTLFAVLIYIVGTVPDGAADWAANADNMAVAMRAVNLVFITGCQK